MAEKQQPLIPSGASLKDKPLVFKISTQKTLPIGKTKIDFGALLKHPIEIHGRHYPLTGWLGPRGKTIPVVAEYHEESEKAKNKEKDKPSIRIFAEAHGGLHEVAVAFKKPGKEVGTFFHSGFTTTDPKHDIVLNPKHENDGTSEILDA